MRMSADSKSPYFSPRVLDVVSITVHGKDMRKHCVEFDTVLGWVRNYVVNGVDNLLSANGEWVTKKTYGRVVVKFRED